MKIRLTFELDDYARRAIANHYGQPGKASRDDIEHWIRLAIDATLDDLAFDLDRDEKDAG